MYRAMWWDNVPSNVEGQCTQECGGAMYLASGGTMYLDMWWDNAPSDVEGQCT